MNKLDIMIAFSNTLFNQSKMKTIIIVRTLLLATSLLHSGSEELIAEEVERANKHNTGVVPGLEGSHKQGAGAHSHGELGRCKKSQQK